MNYQAAGRKQPPEPRRRPSLSRKAITLWGTACGIAALWIVALVRTTEMPVRNLAEVVDFVKGVRYGPLKGHVYSGVRVYFRWKPEDRLGLHPVLTILGGSDHYQPPAKPGNRDAVKPRTTPAPRPGTKPVFDGLKIQTYAGTNWGRRDVMENAPYYFVRTDDPALVSPQWIHYKE